MSTQTISPEQDSELVASVAAEQLGIKAVTLRKYSTMVENSLTMKIASARPITVIAYIQPLI